MARDKTRGHFLSRRQFLRGLSWAPALFFPAPLHGSFLRAPSSAPQRGSTTGIEFSDIRYIPHYPAKSPLEDMLGLVAPGLDEFTPEKDAFEIEQVMGAWSMGLKESHPALDILAPSVDAFVITGSLVPTQEIALRRDESLEIIHRRFSDEVRQSREYFLEQMKTYLADVERIETAEFQIVRIKERHGSSLATDVQIRYDITGVRKDGAREQRVGHWLTLWTRDNASGWRVQKWQATEETLSRAFDPIFADVTAHSLGAAPSYTKQLLCGVDEWRTRLDGACGIDVYGNSGIAAGDFDGDGRDDFYVCQPAGLPNRLYRNRGDGTFEDATDAAGVGVLDGTACALFADFDNRGLQDLLVVCSSGPLLFRNQGNGTFGLKRDAFHFAQPPQGTFTHAAVADYDRDGRLDIYFCLYSYYLSLDQYHYPSPYFDARNGPPNFLFHNEGNGTFVDRTQAAGLNAENDRYSFACAWGDSNGDGWPDLYVANDFGRSNLYRNNGDGTLTADSAAAGVDDAGAGMSACWADFDNSGKQDIYVANMWSAAGLRISEQRMFHEAEPETIRQLYRRHASGNSLYRNLGNGTFQNVAAEAGAAMGRWAWGSDSWDFDHDGFSDLYIANGYISGPDTRDADSFFWRQVVGNSPQTSAPAPKYEHSWNAINEWIRSDASWNGRERNVLYANNRDGSFSEVSGIAGMNFLDDSRAFALADLDGDGRLEVILKNRNAPQIRVLQNAMKHIGDAIAFRLRGTRSNRDAIGTSITVESGDLRQTKYLQAGSGFLSQHTKEVFFGLGKYQNEIRATIRWPSGETQRFGGLPRNHRVEVLEGSGKITASPFAAPQALFNQPTAALHQAAKPETIETWLIQPLRAPDFSLPDLTGQMRELRSFRGDFTLLCFWATDSLACREQLRLFQNLQRRLVSQGVRVVAISVSPSDDSDGARSVATAERISFPILLATHEIADTYNIIYRYLFDRRRDLLLPSSFLVGPEGMLEKLYQGLVDPDHVVADVQSTPRTLQERQAMALPFPGTLYRDSFQRNDFTYGVAMFQRGYLEQAAAAFQQVLISKPDNLEAHYNLGTLYLRKNDLKNARLYLEQTLKLRKDYPEAWNNLGMAAAQEGHADEAVRNFEQSLRLRPDYAVALLNLGNLYRRQGALENAGKLLRRALELEPQNAEANYSFGMLGARREQFESATQYLEKAVALRPDYADALNNLGVLYVRERRYAEAEERFKTCIRVAPDFDQAYLNLARLYVLLTEKQKAREALKALLNRQPEHQLAHQALEMLN